MKKFAFLAVFGFLAVSLFAQNKINYDKILKGDLSDFAGYWVNGENRRVYLQADGKINHLIDGRLDIGSGAGHFVKYGNNSDIYQWNATDGIGMGFAAWLYPVGVDAIRYDGIAKSDKTKVRLVLGHDPILNPEEFYYRESEFLVTHITSDNLRIRTDQKLSSATIKVLEKGAKVQVQKWGKYESIDGNNARWAYIITIDGIAGWCYSGYLKELQK
jgi:hypothetical protein